MVQRSGLASLASRERGAVLPMGKIAKFGFLTFTFVCFLAASAGAQVSVLTQNSDSERDAVYSNETQLTPTSTIHKLFTMSLDNPVMGQALILGGVNVSGFPANVLLVVTSPNESAGATSAWAFNADTGAQLWQFSLGTNAAFNTATPVVDPNLGPHGALFVVTKNSSTNVNELHAIDVLAGTELTGSPMTISASADGVSFDSAQENDRTALLDLNGTIYTSFCHMTDSGTYHGWLIGYKYTTGSGFTQNGVWCDTCANGGNEGGIWQGGDGVIYDGTSIFVATGNGTIGSGNYGMSIVQLSPSNLGTVESSYLPPNAQSNSNSDLDLNGGGMVIMPGTGGKIFIGPTKYGAMYLVNDADLSAAAIDTYSTNGAIGHSPIAWNSGTAQYAYVWPSGSAIQQYCYSGGSTGSAPCEQSTFTAGGTLAISSTPTGANAILWAYGGNELHAMNPTNVSAADYWNSNESSGDSTGTGPGGFQYIAVANGKVYVPSGNNLIAYGSPAAVSCTAAPTVPGSLAATTASSSQINLSWSGSTASAGCSITYNVYESTTSGFTPLTSNLIANSVSGTTYSAAGLAATTTYYYVVEAVDSFGSSAASTQVSATTSSGSTTEGPYGGRAAAIPGTVMAENYDTGGQGVGYYVTSVNGTDNAYRTDGVDLETATAPATGNDLGWTAAGQWFRYTVNVATAGTYTVSILVAAPDAVADAFHISNSAGTNLSGSVAVPATGGYQTWVTVTATVTLPTGTQTLTVDQDAAGWNIDSMIFASSGGSSTSIVSINSGGPAVSNSGGGDNSFVADEDYSTGGTTYAVTNAITIPASIASIAAPAAVYQDARQGTVTYTIPGLTAGASYTVRLHFAELYFAAAGDRVFDVAINGTAVLTNFDIYATAGAQYTAVVENFTATANSSGDIVIAFTNGTTNQPMFNGIEVLGSATSCSAIPSAPTGLKATASSSSAIGLTWTAVTPPANCSISSYSVYGSTTSGFTPSSSNLLSSTVTGTSYTNSGLTASTTYYYVVEAVDAEGNSAPSTQASATTPAAGTQTEVVAINFEGPAVSNSGGGDYPFVADEYFTGGGAATPTTATISTTTAGANAAPMAVYQTQRDGVFTYTIPNLTAGATYTVLIHCAEIYFSAAGDREYDVAINGTTVLTNFDQFAAAGGKDIAVVESFNTTANSSGQIVVSFTDGAVNQPSVAGLEIRTN